VRVQERPRTSELWGDPVPGGVRAGMPVEKYNRWSVSAMSRPQPRLSHVRMVEREAFEHTTSPIRVCRLQTPNDLLAPQVDRPAGDRQLTAVGSKFDESLVEVVGDAGVEKLGEQRVVDGEPADVVDVGGDAGRDGVEYLVERATSAVGVRQAA
jgi:hypothetical protein